MPVSDCPFARSSGLNPEPGGGKGFASPNPASMLSHHDVFTTDEIARAAGVPLASVERLIDAGGVRPVAGSFFDMRAAVRAGHLARRAAAAVASPLSNAPAADRRQEGFSAVASSLVHVALLAALIWSTSGVRKMTD